MTSVNTSQNVLSAIPVEETGGSVVDGDNVSSFEGAMSMVSDQKIVVNMTESLFETAETGVESDLIDFLERPYVLRTGVLSISDTVNTFSPAFPISELCQQTMFRNKVAGRYLIRADIEAVLQVNGTPFHQGRYILAWIPTAGANSGNATNWIKMHAGTLCQRTQLPHVEIDVCKQSACSITVPYATPKMGYTPNSTGDVLGDNGCFYIFPYEPLNCVTGNTAISFCLWLKMKNVRLGAPCIPMMDFGGPSLKEAKAADIGPVTSAVTKVGTTMGILGKIPFLAPFMKPGKAIADVVAEASATWGLCRPRNQAPVSRVVQATGAFNANADAGDTCQSIALMQTNAISGETNLGGTNIDEMSIDYIKSIPAYIGSESWSISNNAGDNITTIPLTPSYFKSLHTDVVSFYDWTPVAFVASLFKFWRGSLKVTFKVVKTDFHSGRLLLAYSPFPLVGTPAAPTIYTGAYLHREILDIRTQSEFSFIIPYVSQTAYRGYAEPMGWLYVTVLDKLIAPVTVPSTVKILVEVSGGPDFEVAVPTTEDQRAVFLPHALQMDFNSPPETPKDIVLGNGKMPTYRTVAASSCIGEQVRSLKMLLKRYNRWFTVPTTTFDMWPFLHRITVSDGTNHTADLASSDLLSLIECCYAMARGSVRVRVLGIPMSNSEVTFGPEGGTLGSVAANNSVDRRDFQCVPKLLFNDATMGISEIELPQYHRDPARTVAAQVVASTFVNQSEANFCSNTLSLSVYSDLGEYSARVLRSVGEDYAAICFVSTPLTCDVSL